MTENKSRNFPADLIGLPLTLQEAIQIMDNRKRRKVLVARIDSLDTKRETMTTEHATLIDAEGALLADADGRRVVE